VVSADETSCLHSFAGIATRAGGRCDTCFRGAILQQLPVLRDEGIARVDALHGMHRIVKLGALVRRQQRIAMRATRSRTAAATVA